MTASSAGVSLSVFGHSTLRGSHRADQPDAGSDSRLIEAAERVLKVDLLLQAALSHQTGLILRTRGWLLSYSCLEPFEPDIYHWGLHLVCKV